MGCYLRWRLVDEGEEGSWKGVGAVMMGWCCG